MISGDSANVDIFHVTYHTDGTEGSDSPPLAAYEDNIKEVDMPENEPAEIIDVDAGNATDGEH